MATLENGKYNAESSRQDISFEFQSKDLPSRRLLGKGLSGIGYETAWKGARYARKDFVGVQRDIFLQEATVLVGLEDHKNIVKTYGWTVDKRSCSLVLEYMDEDLLSLLQKRMDSKRGAVGKDLGKQSSTFTSAQPVDLSEAVDMMLQIATGVEYLHEQGLAHGDLKTKNILVTHRKDGAQSSKVLKLSDFGLVGTKRKSKYIVSRTVRKLDMVRWKSPESTKILSRRLHSSNGDEGETSSESESESTPSSVPEVSSACAGMKSSDVYSFALICSQILTGHTPYPETAWKELMFTILSGCRPELPVSCHPLLRELLISCWGDPAERPSFSAVRMKLKRVQGLLTAAMGKRPQEVTAPSLADFPAHQAALVPTPESFGNCLSPKPSKGPAIVPSEWTAEVATFRSNALGVPSSAPSSPAADESYEEIRSLDDIVPSSEPTQSGDLRRFEEELLRDLMTDFDPSVKSFSDRSSFTTSSDLNNDPTIGRGSNLTFIENEGGTFRFRDMSAPEVKSGTVKTRNKLPNALRYPLAGFLELRQPVSLSSSSQGPPLLRDLKQGVRTHEAVSQSTVSQGPPLIARWEPDILSDVVKTGTMDVGNAVVPGSFKAWQRTPVLPPSQRKRENQWLLRRCFDTLRSLPRPPLISSFKSDILGDTEVEPFLHYKVNPKQFNGRARSMPHREIDEAPIVGHVLAERNRRKRLNENFSALRKLLPTESKNDKTSVLGDAIAYLEDLKREIHGLEASKSQVERQYEDLKLSHQDLEQQNLLLKSNKSDVDRKYEDLKLSHEELEQRNLRLKSSKSDKESEYEDLNLAHQVLQQRNKVLEARMNGQDWSPETSNWRQQRHTFQPYIRKTSPSDTVAPQLLRAVGSTMTVQTIGSMDLHGMLQAVALGGSWDAAQAEATIISSGKFWGTNVFFHLLNP